MSRSVEHEFEDIYTWQFTWFPVTLQGYNHSMETAWMKWVVRREFKVWGRLYTAYDYYDPSDSTWAKRNPRKGESVMKGTTSFIIVCLAILSAITSLGVWLYNQPSRTALLEEIPEQYEVIGFRPPKHFGVSLKNVKTGEIHNNVNVSKHFNEWKEIPLGSIITINKRRWAYDDGTEQWETFRYGDIEKELRRVLREKP